MVSLQANVLLRSLGLPSPGVLWCDQLSVSDLLFLSPEARPVEDDSPKALPVLGELSNSNNDINESMFIWGISHKAAQRKTISVDEGLFHLQQEKQQQQQQRLEPVRRLGRGGGRLKLPHVSSLLCFLCSWERNAGEGSQLWGGRACKGWGFPWGWGWEAWFTQLTSTFGICPPLPKEVQECAHTHLHFLCWF